MLLPSFDSFGEAVSVEKIKKISQSETKICLWPPWLLIPFIRRILLSTNISLIFKKSIQVFVVYILYFKFL